MADDHYSTWRAALKGTAPDTQQTANLAGFWRVVGARTKHDTPVAIWFPAGSERMVLKEGTRPTVDEGSKSWSAWVNWGWPKCIAVVEKEYHAAVAMGIWDDGKPAVEQAKETPEHVAPRAPGGNNPPAEEELADQIKTLSETIAAVPEPADQAAADALTEKMDRLKALLDKAEKTREAEKAPFLEGGRQVDAKWKNIGEPAEIIYRGAKDRRAAFLRKEQKRIDDAAAAETQRRQQEADRAAAEEAERRAEELARSGMPEEEIERHIEETTPPPPAVEPVKAEKARAGGAYGRRTGLTKRRYAVVEDWSALAEYFIKAEHDGLRLWLQDQANAAIRSKAQIILPGCKLEEREE